MLRVLSVNLILMMIQLFNFFKFFFLVGDPLLLKNSYFVIIFFSLIGLVLSCILVFIPYFFTGRSVKTVEKVSEYECGFEPFDSAIRQPFTVHFYIVGILFLIFDVEIALLFP